MRLNAPLLLASITLMVAVLPLAMKLIEPNGFYGIRTSRVCASRPLWFKVNAFSGWILFIVSAIGLVVSFLPLLYNKLESGTSWIIFITALSIAFIVVIGYAFLAKTPDK